MAKPDLSNSPLLPLVLIAGLLSGTLWRSASPPAPLTPGQATAVAERSDVAPFAAPWISELRPVMNTIAAALGVPASETYGPLVPNGPVATSKRDSKSRNENETVLAAMRTLRRQLDAAVAPSGMLCGPPPQPAEDAVEVLAAALLADNRDEVKPRNAAAKALVDEFRDWRLLVNLARLVHDSHEPNVHYDVKFLVATIPDYVDSNSGWLADQSLAAIQSGMSRDKYLFDRIRLVDWSRGADSTAIVANSRLHERQPGALIFRYIEGKTVHLQVMLLVLETPTAGVHQVALRNSASFIGAWNACIGPDKAPLRVLGPTFSGSIASLATVLAESRIKNSFSGRVAITGSANADENVEKMTNLSDNAVYRATIQPSSVIKKQMAEFLGTMNGSWRSGEHVALLMESNTAYGNPGTESGPFPQAAVFRFPLHVSQLRSDAPTSPQAASALLPTALIPLNMREATPPSDLIPALRPQLTSSVVEATVDSILDAIRHEKRSAVGILATDDRDTLFLAREVKRAAPDTQLFLFGTHSLYLHPDYVPYLRGTLVASWSSLSLANQPEIGEPNQRTREPFQSMSAEGLFYATHALLSVDTEAKAAGIATLPQCDGSLKDCFPLATVSISVIGEDGYWPLPSAAASPMPAINVYPLPPLPGRTLIAVALVGVVVLAHLIVLYLIKRDLHRDLKRHPFLELPFVRVLAPAATVEPFAAYHRLGMQVCFVSLALVAAWLLTIIVPFRLPKNAPRFLPAVLSMLLLIGLAVAGAMWTRLSRVVSETDVRPDYREPSIDASAAQMICYWTGRLLFVGILATIVLFGAATIGFIRDGMHSESAILLGRFVGGGIVSPLALTVCLFAAIHTGLLTGIRRLSLVGYGYKTLSWHSRAFAMLTGEPAAKPDRPTETPGLARMLDMPAYNMSAVYPLMLLLGLAMACIGVKQITTFDGWMFSWFVRIGSLTALGFGLFVLAQGLATWNTARSHLKRLARSPVESEFEAIARHVPWDVSLAPPRLTEMMPVARLADRVIRNFRTLAAPVAYVPDYKNIRRNLLDFSPYREKSEDRFGLRDGDLVQEKQLFASPKYVEDLQVEMSEREHAALIQSKTWFKLWILSDAIVCMLEKTYWARAKPVETQKPVATVVEGEAGTEWLAWKHDARAAISGVRRQVVPLPSGPIGPNLTGANSETADVERPDSAVQDGWFAECAQLVALQIAFVLRDIVARTITCLFAAMLCLTFLTASHLLYSFNGRASMLTIDLLAVAGVALSAVWILVDMERDHVLSRLRTTTPVRIDLNWDFIKRIAIYGVLPLLAVIASLFPEIGGTLFGWLEPIRKLSNF